MLKTITDGMWLKERICCECGKSFWIDPMFYAYKVEYDSGRYWWYCGYPCWRKEDRRRREKDARIAAKLMKQAERYNEDGELIRKSA